ncbi:M56 family metallopeptidase [Flavivirga eckloniae]|uniref:BlaR1 peptidase M56 family protein n=1 Tax=Flavivirga eckloniae TaxID=1803846 RepID=A0A2K9PSV3_9FLAO|nr:M56 family metallopeptidase [Flavivirga eckloniae]AUP80144.1 blaR1 peptidase M56 family protein [Flavivirga eckloniae]
MVHYIINTIVFQLFFLIIYDWFLKKETFFDWNRAYLLITSLLSLIIPFIKIRHFKEVLPKEYIISLPEVIIGGIQPTRSDALQLNALQSETVSIWTWELVLYTGMLLTILLFLFKIFKLIRIVSKNPKWKQGNLLIVKILNSKMAFSCFHFIFLGEELNEEEKESILKHEMVHVKQKHTLDLLFFEIQRILFWFNPLVYMYQNRIMQLHEFIADKKAIKTHNKKAYYENLLSQVFETKNMSFINPFFKQSLIKKRIIMLQKSKSNQINLIKYAFLIPIVLGMLIYSSCEYQNETDQTSSLDLSQYNYSVKLNELDTEEIIEAKRKQENFIDENPNYVIWLSLGSEKEEIVYSVHAINEKVPEEYIPWRMKTRNGSPYKIFVESKNLLNSKEAFKDESDVPLAIISQAPVFPGCENLPRSEQKKCLTHSIAKHVNRNFNTKLASRLNLIGKQRINIIFKINKDGNIGVVRVRAPHPVLENESVRVIKTLPKMIPGEHQGEKATVLYSLPIIFQVRE